MSVTILKSASQTTGQNTTFETPPARSPSGSPTVVPPTTTSPSVSSQESTHTMTTGSLTGDLTGETGPALNATVTSKDTPSNSTFMAIISGTNIEPPVTTVILYSSSPTVTVMLPNGEAWSKRKGGVSTSTIVGVVLGVLAMLTLGLALLLWWIRRMRRAEESLPGGRKYIDPYTDESLAGSMIEEKATQQSRERNLSSTRLSSSAIVPFTLQLAQSPLASPERALPAGQILATAPPLRSDMLHLASNHSRIAAPGSEVLPDYQSLYEAPPPRGKPLY